MECKKCGNVLPENAKFCFECGAKVEQELICAACGAKMPVGYKFCMECGGVLSDSGKNKIEKEADGTSKAGAEEVNWDELFAGMPEYQEEIPAPSENSKYDTWWSEMYGEWNYVVYKGYIYCIVPACILTGNDFSGDIRKNWVIARLDISSGTTAILKKINTEDYPKWATFTFDNSRSRQVPFSIYDNKIYYCLELGDEPTKVFIFDINTMKETTKTIILKNADSYICGIFKGCNEELCIKSEYDYKKDASNDCISSFDGQRKKRLAPPDCYCKKIVAYNECYVYYEVGTYGMGDDELYAVNLETFEVINLSHKLTKLKKGSFYSVDPRKDVIYVLGEDKMMSVNMNNEIVEELSIPELPDYVMLSKRVGREAFRYVNSLARDPHGVRLCYNGENWILRVNPEDVENDMRKGIIVFDKKCVESGSWLTYKNDGGFVSQARIVFVFPTAIALLDEVVDEEGTVHTFDFPEREKRGAWHGSVLSVTRNDVTDTGIDLYGPR